VIGQKMKRHNARRDKGKWYYKLYYPDSWSFDSYCYDLYNYDLYTS
jgi:hypothetical protein